MLRALTVTQTISCTNRALAIASDCESSTCIATVGFTIRRSEGFLQSLPVPRCQPAAAEAIKSEMGSASPLLVSGLLRRDDENCS